MSLMKTFLTHSLLFVAFLCTVGIAQSQTIDAVSAQGAHMTQSSSFVDVTGASVTINSTGVNYVLVVATFQLDLTALSESSRDAGLRIVNASAPNTINSGEFHRGMALAKSTDYGIGSIVYIFNVTSSTSKTYTLQHNITSNLKLNTSATIVAMALKAGSEHLKNDVKRAVDFDMAVEPKGTWGVVTGTETAAITPTTYGGFYVAASIQGKAKESASSAEWKL